MICISFAIPIGPPSARAAAKPAGPVIRFVLRPVPDGSSAAVPKATKLIPARIRNRPKRLREALLTRVRKTAGVVLTLPSMWGLTSRKIRQTWENVAETVGISSDWRLEHVCSVPVPTKPESITRRTCTKCRTSASGQSLWPTP